MRFLLTLVSVLFIAGCQFTSSLRYKDPQAPVEERVENLLSQMTLEEKIAQLSQSLCGENDNPNNQGGKQIFLDGQIGSAISTADDPATHNKLNKYAMENTRLGIPIMFAYDVIHGYRTIYPIPLAQSCSFNPELVRQACSVAAKETAATGLHWTFAPMIDVSRDPRWGRVAECYGEDPYVNGIFGAASVHGFQGDDLTSPDTIAACLKHYVGYSESEGGRDYNYSDCSMQTLWDIYLPPYKAGVDAGVCTVMSGFNDLNGIPTSANHYTLTEILRDQWRFDGFVVSDWNSIKQLIRQGYAEDTADAAEKALEAGVEVDMKDNCYLDNLESLVDAGRVKMSVIDEAVRRILRIKFRMGLFDNPYTQVLPENERYLKPEYLQVAQDLALESMVLLKNENNLLPIAPDKKIALIGPLAKDRISLMGSWRAKGREQDCQTLYEGFAEVLGGTDNLLYAKGCDTSGGDQSEFDEAVQIASQADVVLLCIGELAWMSGENASMSKIKLSWIQEQLVDRIAKTNKPIVLVLSNGRPLELVNIEPKATAILEIWQPGLRGGSALADIVVGNKAPSGKLSISFPRTIGHIPSYYNHRRGGRQWTYRDSQTEPLYNFGDGLSYTTFEYSDLKISKDTISKTQTLHAQVTVTNTGTVSAKETIFWYITDHFASITRPVKELKKFEKRQIDPGQSITFTFEIDPSVHLSFPDSTGKRILEAGKFTLNVSNQKQLLFELTDK